jgi:heme a synthase
VTDEAKGIFNMSGFVLQQQNIEANAQPKDKIRRLVWKMCIATLILMAIGSATRVMNAGLACPDWPLCYGELVPTKQMNLQVFLEWFHRFCFIFDCFSRYTGRLDCNSTVTF